MSISYKDSGVDITKGYELVNRIASSVAETHTPQVLSALGSFGALYELPHYHNPVLVSGTDGVGTKLLLAIKHNMLAQIGQDCVAMCINDIVCHGATPLFFLDYLACGVLNPEEAAVLVQSMAQACKSCNCALVGGETAEMPGIYKSGDYDVAGFVVGIIEKDKIIDGSRITKGDIIIGCASDGLHSNGFSLVRKIFEDTSTPFDGQPLYHTLLTPTRIYANTILSLLQKYDSSTIKGIAHITGGGIIENIPRIIPEKLCAIISRHTIPSQPIFELLRNTHHVEELELWNTFNMGMGLALVVSQEHSQTILQALAECPFRTFICGQVQDHTQVPSQYFYKEQKICIL